MSVWVEQTELTRDPENCRIYVHVFMTLFVQYAFSILFFSKFYETKNQTDCSNEKWLTWSSVTLTKKNSILIQG